MDFDSEDEVPADPATAAAAAAAAADDDDDDDDFLNDDVLGISTQEP
jgi:hypothetical protein